MSASAGQHSSSSFESRSSGGELRRYVMKSTDDLGKAYNRAEQRIYELGTEVGEKLRPDLEDVRDRAANLEPRVSKLEELMVPYNVYESDVRKAVKKLKNIEGKIESTLRLVPFQAINQKFEDLTNRISTLANEVDQIGKAMKEISDMQTKTSIALERGFLTLHQEVKLLRSSVAKTMHLPRTQVTGRTEAEVRRLDPFLHKHTSNSQQSPSGAKATAPSALNSNHTSSSLVSADDLGRDLLSRLLQGQEIDHGLLQHLTARLSEISPPEPLSMDAVSPGRNSKVKPSRRYQESGKTAVAQLSSRKRSRQETAEDDTLPLKRSGYPGRTKPSLTPSAPAKTLDVTSDEDLAVSPSQSRAPTTRSKTKQSTAHQASDADDDDHGHDSASIPPPRRTTRAIKPTERAGDFMKARTRGQTVSSQEQTLGLSLLKSDL